MRIQAGGPDPAAWTVSLNGTWEFAPEDSSEFAAVKVPGFWGAAPQAQKVGHKVAVQWKTGTYRRDFEVPAGMTGAVLEFDMLRWGGEVFVNGQSAGTYDLGHSPARFDIRSLIRPGTNRLEVKCRGWAALERLGGKDLQIPIGAGNWFGIKDGGIPDDVTLRLYKDAWIDSLVIKAIRPGVPCSVSTRVGSGPAGFKGQIAAQVVTEEGHEAVSEVARKAIEVEPGKVVDVEVRGIQALSARAWQPIVSGSVPHGGLAGERAGAADRRTRRHLRVPASEGLVEGRLCVNGQPVPLFGGTELVMYSMLQLLDDDAKLKRVQVDLFKGMNGTAFRSHMNPLPRRWLDLCDRYGILVIPEFPNFPDVQRTSGESPYELPDYPKNLFREARGIIAARMQSPVHRGLVGVQRGQRLRRLGAREPGPVREVARSGPDGHAVGRHDGRPGGPAQLRGHVVGHVRASSCGAWRTWRGSTPAGCWAAASSASSGRRSAGTARATVTGQSAEFKDDHARILMEQTEAFRRARYGLIMPYSYGGGWFGKQAGETGKVEDAAAPYHALRNALAPLGVSFEAPRHAVAGTTLEVPVWLYSDAASASGEVAVSLYLLDKNPGYDWAGQTEGVKVLGEAGLAVTIQPWQCVRRSVSLESAGRSGRALPRCRRPRCQDGQGARHQPEGAASLRADGQSRQAAARRRDREGWAACQLASAARAPGRDGVRRHQARCDRVFRGVPLRRADPHVGGVDDGAGPCGHAAGGPGAGQLGCEGHAVGHQQGADGGLTAVPQQTSLENLFPAASLAEAVGTRGRLPAAQRPGQRGDAGGAGCRRSRGRQGRLRGAPARLTPEAAATQAAGAAATQPSVWTSLIDGYGLRGRSRAGRWRRGRSARAGCWLARCRCWGGWIRRMPDSSIR